MKNQERNYQGVKAFLIARVSDPSQREALPAQEIRIKDYAERKELKGTLYSFDETAYKTDREKFLTIVNEISECKDYCVVVFDKVDRFTRDCTADVVRTLKGATKEGKIELHFPSDGLTVHKNSPASDWFRLDMGMALGGYYSAAISDNVKRKIEQKLHEGEWPGKAPIGYKNIDILDKDEKVIGKNIVKDRMRSSHIEQIFNLRLDRQSFRTIARIMREEGLTSNTKQAKPIGQSQIEQILKNPFYHGVMRYNGGLHPHKYEPIISKQLFDRVQQVNEDRATDTSKTEVVHKFTFNNLLKCHNCGCSISSYTKKGHTYMQCSKAKGPCDQPHTSEAVLLPQVDSLLDDLQKVGPYIDAVLDNLKKEHDNLQTYYTSAISEARKQYDRLEKRLGILYEDRLDGRITIDEHDKIVTKTKAEMQKLDEKLVQLTSGDKSFVITSSYLLQLASIAGRLFKSSKPELKSKILNLVLSNLELDNKKLHFNLLSPFDKLLALSQSSIWLRRPDSNRRPIG